MGRLRTCQFVSGNIRCTVFLLKPSRNATVRRPPRHAEPGAEPYPRYFDAIRQLFPGAQLQLGLAIGRLHIPEVLLVFLMDIERIGPQRLRFKLR